MSAKARRDHIRELLADLKLPAALEAVDEVLADVVPGDACRDPNDIPVLGTVVAGAVTAMIAGDKDLLELKHFRGIRIVGSGAFWAPAHASAHR
jgi:predicted nucleic acid-binding protein